MINIKLVSICTQNCNKIKMFIFAYFEIEINVRKVRLEKFDGNLSTCIRKIITVDVLSGFMGSCWHSTEISAEKQPENLPDFFQKFMNHMISPVPNAPLPAILGVQAFGRSRMFT